MKDSIIYHTFEYIQTIFTIINTIGFLITNVFFTIFNSVIYAYSFKTKFFTKDEYKIIE